MRREIAVATSPALTRGSRPESQSRLRWVERLPSVLVAHTDPVQRTAATPEQHTGCVRGGVEVAEDDRRPLSGIPLDSKRSAQRLLFPLGLERERPVRLVVRHNQPTEGCLELHDQGCAPRQVSTVFGGALVYLFQHPMGSPGWPAPRRRRSRSRPRTE